MQRRFEFNRLELAGSLGDLGALLPLGIGMIMINGLSPSGLFFSIGLFYFLSGVYYGVTVPVQPMKVIGAYAVATALNADQISAAGLLMGLTLLVVGGTNLISLVVRYIPKVVVRGVQISTGTLLMVQGVKFIAGTSTFQQMAGLAEPHLAVQQIGPVPVGILIGIIGGLVTFRFLSHQKFPAAIMVLMLGLAAGVLMGTREGFDTFRPGIYLPGILPFGFPSGADVSFALMVLVVPQLPMTLGNAVIANADLSRQYFDKASEKVTYRALCFSMGIANLISFCFGGMPLCHGAGGLAAHYRFGARTAGSNLIIGLIFMVLAVFLGVHALTLIHLIPYSVLGVLLVFAGTQLTLTIMDMSARKDLFVCFLMLGITLAANLAVAFGAGILAAYALKSGKLSV